MRQDLDKSTTAYRLSLLVRFHSLILMKDILSSIPLRKKEKIIRCLKGLFIIKLGVLLLIFTAIKMAGGGDGRFSLIVPIIIAFATLIFGYATIYSAFKKRRHEALDEISEMLVRYDAFSEREKPDPGSVSFSKSFRSYFKDEEREFAKMMRESEVANSRARNQV